MHEEAQHEPRGNRVQQGRETHVVVIAFLSGSTPNSGLRGLKDPRPASIGTRVPSFSLLGVPSLIRNDLLVFPLIYWRRKYDIHRGLEDRVSISGAGGRPGPREVTLAGKAWFSPLTNDVGYRHRMLPGRFPEMDKTKNCPLKVPSSAGAI